MTTEPRWEPRGKRGRGSSFSLGQNTRTSGAKNRGENLGEPRVQRVMAGVGERAQGARPHPIHRSSPRDMRVNPRSRDIANARCSPGLTIHSNKGPAGR
jgi:hypothetical protein